MLYIVIPLATTIAAWATYQLILWSLIYPRHSLMIGGSKIQGLMPRMQQEPELIAEIIANMAMNVIHSKHLSSDMSAVRPTIEQHLDAFLTIRLKEKMPVVASFIGPSTTTKLKESMIEEIDVLLPTVVSNYLSNEYTKEKIQKKIADAIREIPHQNILDTLKKGKKSISIMVLLPLFAGVITGLLMDLIYYMLHH